MSRLVLPRLVKRQRILCCHPDHAKLRGGIQGVVDIDARHDSDRALSGYMCSACAKREPNPLGQTGPLDFRSCRCGRLSYAVEAGHDLEISCGRNCGHTA